MATDTGLPSPRDLGSPSSLEQNTEPAPGSSHDPPSAQPGAPADFEEVTVDIPDEHTPEPMHGSEQPTHTSASLHYGLPAAPAPSTGLLTTSPSPLQTRIAHLEKLLALELQAHGHTRKAMKVTEEMLAQAMQSAAEGWNRLAAAGELAAQHQKLLEEAQSTIEDLEASLERQTRLLEARQRRNAKEQVQTRLFAHEHAIREILPAIDDLERALVHGQASPAMLLDGVSMVLRNLQRALEKLSVERIAAEPGTPFDPVIHEALLHRQSTEHPQGSILQELRAGFTINGRLLRPAGVIVSTAPPPTPAVKEPPVPTESDDAMTSGDTPSVEE